MAIQWSGWSYAGGNGMRIGLDVSVSAVSNSSSSCTVTWKVYTQNQYNYADNGQTVQWSNAITATDTYNNTQGAGSVTLRATRTTVHNYTTWGSSPGYHDVKVRIGYSYNGSHPEITVRQTIPARPYAAPAAPTMGGAIRNSDTQATLSWTNNATAGRPYSTITVTRRLSWNDDFTTVATVPGTSTSWVDGGIIANRQVQYQIRANNSAGSSAGSGFSSTFYTSPAAPTGVAASLSGGSIVVVWSNNVPYGPNYAVFVERSSAGGAWSVVASGLSSPTVTWTDTAPPGGSNQYRVRAKAIDTPGNTGPYGPYGLSNVVSTMVPPLAPTLLAPSGQARDAHLPITLAWQHNPGGDAAPQTSYQVRYSSNSGSTWTTIGPVTSAVSQHVLPVDTLTNGVSYLWQVATKGTHASYGPWSASATLPTSTTPVVTITTPTAGPVVTLPVVAEWIFAQDQGLTQAGWEARLSDTSGQVLQLGSGTTETAWTVTAATVDGASYQLEVRARSTAGLWSAWQTVGIVIDLLPPADVTITPTLDPGTGWMVLALHADDATPPGSPLTLGPGLLLGPDVLLGEASATSPVDHVVVQRRIDGGPWVTITPEISFDDTSDQTILDTTPSLKAVHEYRAVVTSISPSVAVTDPVVVVTEGEKSTCWCFLSWGPGFGQIVRAGVNVALSSSPSVESALQPVAGRAFPLLLSGSQKQMDRQVSMLADWSRGESSTDAEFIAAGMQKGVFCFRDHLGVRIFGRLSGMQVTPSAAYVNQTAQIRFSIEQIDFQEGV